MIHGGNLFDQFPAEELCVKLYALYDMMSVQSVTRQHNIDPVLGIIGSELDNKQLPSNKDIIKICMWEETKLKSTVINPSWNLVKANLRSSALDTWISASIPIVTLRCVKYMVHTLYNKYRSKSK